LAQWAGDQFTTTEAVRRDRKSKQAISGWLNDLCDAGAVEQVEPRRGNRPAIWRLTAMDHADLAAGDSGLPDPAEISV
jgi:hypothetical protein